MLTYQRDLRVLCSKFCFHLLSVHDAGVEENVADSGEDSEDEWNYYKGDSAESEKVSSSKADQEVIKKSSFVINNLY